MEGSRPGRKQLALVFLCEASGEPPAQLYSDERDNSLQIRVQFCLNVIRSVSSIVKSVLVLLG